jgi:hypothetical protein
MQIYLLVCSAVQSDISEEWLFPILSCYLLSGSCVTYSLTLKVDVTGFSETMVASRRTP